MNRKYRVPLHSLAPFFLPQLLTFWNNVVLFFNSQWVNFDNIIINWSPQYHTELFFFFFWSAKFIVLLSSTQSPVSLEIVSATSFRAQNYWNSELYVLQKQWHWLLLGENSNSVAYIQLERSMTFLNTRMKFPKSFIYRAEISFLLKVLLSKEKKKSPPPKKTTSCFPFSLTLLFCVWGLLYCFYSIVYRN